MRSAANAPEPRLAPITRGDLRIVAEVHQRAFPDSGITAFGREALERYYAWLLDGPHDALLVGAWHGDRLVGFCAGGHYRGAVAGFLRNNRRFLVGRVLRHPTLVLNPLIRDRIGEAVRITLKSRSGKGGTVELASAATAVKPRFGILSIATDPSVRGSGAGRALMLEAEARARAKGLPSMSLTVHPSNTRAVRFYEQLGWERQPNERGVWEGHMTKQLAPS